MKPAMQNDNPLVTQKRVARMDVVDALPRPLRALVHEYGYAIVRAHLDIGVKDPKHIKHLVETTLNEFSPTRGSYSKQGLRVEMPQ